MKRQTYLRFFKKWCKKPRASILFVPDTFYYSCLYIMKKNNCFGIGIVKKSNEDLYWLTYYSAEMEDLSRDDCSFNDYVDDFFS